MQSMARHLIVDEQQQLPCPEGSHGDQRGHTIAIGRVVRETGIMKDGTHWMLWGRLGYCLHPMSRFTQFLIPLRQITTCFKFTIMESIFMY